jgi:hypothetical protein
VLFRNRVLHTLLLSGITGEELTAREWLGIQRSLAGLDDRQAFDAAVVLNHSGSGAQRVIVNADSTALVSDGGSIEAAARRVAELLDLAVGIRRTKKLGHNAVKLLARLAVYGHDFYETLTARNIGVLATANRIQIIRLRSEWVFPLELIYDRPAPKFDAKLCPTYESGATTCTGCTNRMAAEFVCPNGFWGLSKTIERHNFDPADAEASDDGYLLAFEPTSTRRTLSLVNAAFAAASEVPDTWQTKVKVGLGSSTAQVNTWDDWRDVLDNRPIQLLVLLPHTDYTAASLFIGNQVELQRGQIERPEVVGHYDDLTPIVVLFGCATAGTGDDPGGFAQRFITKGAATVFTSLSKLLGSHAAELALRLSTLLLDAQRETAPIGVLLTQFRQDAVRDGLVAALAVGAYGDADWRL